MLLLTAEVKAQSSSQNLAKYWYLRDRLLNHFAPIGTGRSESFAAAITYGHDWKYENDTTIHYGDSPNHQALYIGVLATEYRLLKNNGQDVSQTVKELWHAIYAINRMDMNESHCPWNRDGATGNFNGRTDVLNGFYSREDIFEEGSIAWDAGFSSINNNNSLISKVNENVADPALDNQLGNPPKVGLVSCGVYRVIEENGFNFISYPIYPYQKHTVDICQEGAAYSFDYYTSLFVAFAQVVKYLDDGVNFNQQPFQDNETDIKQEVKRITDRMMAYIETGPYGNGTTPFLLLEPDGDEVHKWGRTAVHFAYGMEMAAYKITGDNAYSIKASNLYVPGLIPGESENLWTSLIDIYVGGSDALTALSQFVDANFDYNLLDGTNSVWEVLNIAAVGDSWDEPLRSTQNNIWLASHSNGWESYYPLLHACLQDKNCITSNSTIEDDLNSMPCGGNYNLGDGVVSPGWAVPIKWHYRYGETLSGRSGTDKDGIFNSLDWMMLFNLYCLYNDNYVGSYHKVMHEDLNLTGSLPIVLPTLPSNPYLVAEGSESTGSSAILANPKKYVTTGTITSNQIIENKNLSGTYTAYDFTNQTPVTINITITDNAIADVTYKSASTIRLTSGFHAKPGVKFHAYTAPLHCNSSGTDYERLSNNTNSGKDNTVASPTNEFKQTTPINQNVAISNSGYKTTGAGNVNANRSVASNAASSVAKSGGNIFAIAPNPNTGLFEINYSTILQTNNAVRVSITDVSGRVVWQQQQEGGTSSYIWPVNLSQYSKGLYLIKLQNGEVTKTGRIVIN